MKHFGVLVLFFALSSGLQAQHISLTQFKDSIVPRSGKGDLYDINQSSHRFVVTAGRDSLRVGKFNTDVDTTMCQLEIKQGLLEGHTIGSAGGYLLRFSGAENARPDTIFDRPVRQIVGAHRTVYFSSSVWIPGQRYGHLYILDTAKSAFQAKLVAEFEYPIRQLHAVHDSLYLITGGKLYRFQYGKAVLICDVPFTCNSMAGHGRYLYFGMRGAYARLDLKTKQYRYFVYTGE
jgi:hypothetical protein